MKYLFVSILLSLFYLSSFSQENNIEKLYNFRVGVRLGTSVPKINKIASYLGGYELDPIGRPGINIATPIIFDINEKLAVQPELIASMLVFDHPSFDPQGSPLQGQLRRKLFYFNLPLLINYKILSNKISFQVGPQASFLISNKLSNTTPFTYPLLYPVFENKVLLSALGGIQLNFKTLFISGRYELGFSGLDQKDQWHGYSFKQNSIHFSVGYIIF